MTCCIVSCLGLGAAAGVAIATDPIYNSRILSTGRLWLNVTNFGGIGSAPYLPDGGRDVQFNVPWPAEDARTLQINWIPSLEYYAGSRKNYLGNLGLAFGAIVGIDTLVSTSFGAGCIEFYSYELSKLWSNDPRSSEFHPGAHSPRELNCSYVDTTAGTTANCLDEVENRPHEPLFVDVTQRTLVWQDGMAMNFAIVDIVVRNIGPHILSSPSLGIVVTPHIGHFESPAELGRGVICGHISSIPGVVENTVESTFVVWMADNDGNPAGDGLGRSSVDAALGIKLLRIPDHSIPSFHWWMGDVDRPSWGPTRRDERESSSGDIGKPAGDRGLYRRMTDENIDYDQMYSAKDYSAAGWRSPLSNQATMADIADGGQTSALIGLHLSSPLAPKDSIVFTYALVMGDKFHTKADNFARNFVPNDPAEYRAGLDFSNLHQNSRWAEWIFDTPGVDTDGDGFAGEFHLTNCVVGRCDTVWYRGDGVPDWGGPQAPPAPRFEPTTRPNAVTLRWTGEFSELVPDQFSRRKDFEGYRVYSSRTNTEGGYALIASWDVPDNFRRYAYDPEAGTWRQISYPLTIADWRKEFVNSEFDPLDYSHPSIAHAYRDTVLDSIRDASGQIVQILTRERLSYWAPQGPNHGNSYQDGGVTYPNYIQRVDIRDTVIGEDTLQYGVYEMTLDELNAAIPLWFSVTAFDHGDYRRNLESLEGNPNANTQSTFPQYSANVVVDSGLGVTVYPNPYKILFADVHGNQTNYFTQGYEAYGQPVMDERERRIWFANLPDTATIHIYSLDGDLIREIHHPDKHLTRYSSIVGWDLISRNTQAVTSGIYIWKVDSRLGSQVGKIVIIK